MFCPECKRREKRQAKAEMAFRAARQRLQAINGSLSKEEYKHLLQDVLVSQERLNLARAALDRHIQGHAGDSP
jgi:hypothetical protein